MQKIHYARPIRGRDGLWLRCGRPFVDSEWSRTLAQVTCGHCQRYVAGELPWIGEREAHGRLMVTMRKITVKRALALPWHWTLHAWGSPDVHAGP